MFLKELEDYKRAKKCKSCGHIRFYIDKERNDRRHAVACYCAGYHHPHRPLSTFCLLNPKSEFNTRVLRYKEDALQVGIDLAFDAPVVTIVWKKVPF
jgi:hypothetical protein